MDRIILEAAKEKTPWMENEIAGSTENFVIHNFGLHFAFLPFWTGQRRAIAFSR
jgi:hypothetical protein